MFKLKVLYLNLQLEVEMGHYHLQFQLHISQPSLVHPQEGLQQLMANQFPNLPIVCHLIHIPVYPLPPEVVDQILRQRIFNWHLLNPHQHPLQSVPLMAGHLQYQLAMLLEDKTVYEL